MSRPLFQQDKQSSKNTTLKDKNKIKSLATIGIDYQKGENNSSSNFDITRLSNKTMSSKSFKESMRPRSSFNAPVSQNPNYQKGRPEQMSNAGYLLEKKGIRANNLKQNSNFTRNNRFKESDHLKKTLQHWTGYMDNRDFLNRNTRCNIGGKME